MRGINPTTGTVHSAHTTTFFGVQHLAQDCGTNMMHQRLSLTETTEALTCRRCIAAEAKKTAAAAKAKKTAAAPAAKKASSGPTTWGVYTEAGSLRTWRSTRREALAVAAEGETVAKL